MTRAIRIYEPGPPSVMHIEEISLGTPATADVRMRQEAIGINFVDTMVRDGSFPGEATRVHEDIAARRLGGVPILVP